jgi:hypothetical protein
MVAPQNVSQDVGTSWALGTYPHSLEICWYDTGPESCWKDWIKLGLDAK